MKKPAAPAIKRNPAFWAALGCLAAFGSGLVLYSTVLGAGLSDDSYFYLGAARNLLNRPGPELTPHFPPLFTLILAGIGLLGPDPLPAARYFNAALFGVNIFLTGGYVWVVTRKPWAAAGAALLVLVSDTLLEAHAWALSEPLFMLCLLGGLLWLTRYGSTRRTRDLVITGLWWGAACLARYIGIALLMAGGLWLLLQADRGRIRRVIWFGLAGLAPNLPWLIRNYLLTGKPTSREFAIHLPPESWWLSGVNNFLLWILPGRLVNHHEWLLGSAAALVVLAGLAWAAFRLRGGLYRKSWGFLREPRGALAIAAIFYMLVILFSRFFMDARVPLDKRLLAPLLLMALILLVDALAGAWPGRQTIKLLICAVWVLLAGLYSWRTVDLVDSFRTIGRGFSSARDPISETYAYLRKHPDVPVYSNGKAGIYFWTGKMTLDLPAPEQLSAFRANLPDSGAWVVVFDSIPVDLYGYSLTQLDEGLTVQIQLSEATIYRAP